MQRQRWHRGLVLFLAGLLCCGLVGLWPGTRDAKVKDDYKKKALYIDKYDTELEFYRDNYVIVKERVSVKFNEPRHGVHFELPWVDRNGEKILLQDFKANHPYYAYSAYDDDEEMFIFGNPLKEDTKPQVYELSYRYQMGKNDDVRQNVIYWNIIGDNRGYYHAKVNFKIKLPRAVDKKNIRFYVGEEGSTGGGKRVKWKLQDGGKVIVGSLKGDLAPYEAVTVHIRLPRGYYTQVKEVSSVSYFFARWVHWYDFLVLLFIPLSYRALKKKGIEPPVVETVEFYPPADTNPAEAAYLYYGNSQISDFAPMVVYWADQGAIHIQELPRRDTRFYRRVNYPQGKQYEQKLFMDMFDIGDGSSVRAKEMEEIFYDDLDTAQTRMLSQYTTSQGTSPKDWDAEKKAHKSQRRVALLMSLVPTGILLVNHFYREVAGDGAWLYGIIVAIVGMWLHRKAMLAKPVSSEKREAQTKKLSFFKVNGAQVFLTIILGGLVGLVMWDATALVSFVLYVLTLFYFSYNVRRIDRRSEFGRWNRGKIGGFRTFIQAAELDRIKMLVDENPNYFYHVLPYAMNLGVTDQWIRKFRSLAIPPPEWYSSESGDLGDPSEIPDRLVKTLDRAQSFMTKAPPKQSSSDSSSSYDDDSSGSSSGGSAGGGSGGSGMGDW